MVETHQGDIQQNPELAEKVLQAQVRLLKKIYEKDYSPDKDRFASNIKDILASLYDREKEGVERRFALDGGPVVPRSQLAREWGTTVAQIRRIEGRAINKLRHPTRRNRLEIGY